MKHLSLNKKRAIILLIPFLNIIRVPLFYLVEKFIYDEGAQTFLWFVLSYLYPIVVLGIYYYCFFHHWRCPNCDKHLISILAILFVGWFWLLIMSPKECEHCGKPIDYSKGKKKEKKLPEWAQHLETTKNK